MRKEEDKDIVNELLKFVFSLTSSDEEEENVDDTEFLNMLEEFRLDNPFASDSEETSFELNSEDVNNLFGSPDDYPTAKEVEDKLMQSIISDDKNPFSGLMQSTLDGIKHHEEQKEMVDHPDHYNQGPIETIEKFILFNIDNPDKIKGALEFNLLKYTDRVGHKHATPEGIKEDNSKTNFYYDLYELLFPESTENIDLYRIWKNSKK